MTTVEKVDNNIIVIDGDAYNGYAVFADTLVVGNLRAVFDKDRELIVLNHITIDSLHRGNGLASDLFMELLSWSNVKQAAHIGVYIAESLLQNSTAEEMTCFFESLGLEMNGNFGYLNLKREK